MTWRPGKIAGGQHVVVRIDGGAVSYLKNERGTLWVAASRLAARRRADAANGCSVPQAMTTADLQRRLAGTRISDAMAIALDAILVRGSTWSAAASLSGVTESGIYRAMQRIADAGPV